MKKYIKTFPNKWIYLIIIFFFLGVLFIPIIYTFFTFDLNAPDLVGVDAIFFRNSFVLNELSMNRLLFEFDSIQGIYLNILFISIAFGYQFLKNRMVKYNIGKNTNYNQELFLLKKSTSIFPLTIFTVVICVCILVTLIAHGTIDNISEDAISNQSILSYIIRGNISYLIFYIITKLIALFVDTMLICFLVDIFNSAIKASIAYIILNVVLNVIINHIFPTFDFLNPINSILITGSFNITLKGVLGPYILPAIIYIVGKKAVPYEVK